MASWKATTTEKYGVVVYNFDGKVNHGLPLTIGETVHIFEECSGWYRGCALRRKAVKGIFPATYVHIKDCVVENAGTVMESLVAKEDATVKELTLILREWVVIWKQLYKKHQVHLFEALKKIMWDLIKCRQALISGTLTQDQMDDIKRTAINKIDWGNSKMGLDLIPRVDGQVVDAETKSVVELYKVHVLSTEANLQVYGRGNLKKRPSRVTTVMQHTYLNVTSFVCNIEEKCQVFFSIYDARESRFISERFLVHVSKSGSTQSLNKNDSSQKMNQVQKVENSFCVFTDLGSKDVNSAAYLVAHIVRVGKMLTDMSSKKIAASSYRRPFGCAVLDIMDVLTGRVENLAEKEFHMPIFTCGDSDFWTVHESIIKKQTSKYSATSSGSGILVSLRVFQGDLDKVQHENPLLLPKGIPIVRKLGFPDVIMPGDIRNDLYVTVEKGEFEKGSGKTTSKNVEVSMCVVGPKGKIIEDCVFLGAGGTSITEYQSIIFYHNSSPKWSETIKVQLPFDKFLGAHLRFGFRHLSKFEEKDKAEKTFAFSFVSLMRPDDTTISDGTHELCVYKFDTNCFYDSKTYLHMPSRISQFVNHVNAGSDRLSRSAKDSFTIKTIACSTKLTQNVDLVGLLRWKANMREIPGVLNALLKIDGEEIVKFLQDIFDALFAILNESEEECGNLVFRALVFIIRLLSAEKYQHFQGVLTTYIEKHFSAAMAYQKLMVCLRQALVYNAGENDKMENLKNIMIALEYLFKFIIQSRMMLMSMHQERDEATQESFKNDLHSVFTDINELMSSRLPDATVQASALQHFASIYPEALKVFSVEELSFIVKKFLLSVSGDQKLLANSRLEFIASTVKSSLFLEKESRRILLPVLLSSLQKQLTQKQDMKTCAETLGSLLTCLQSGASGPIEDDVYLVAKSLLQPVFQTVMTVDRTSELARHFLAVLTNLLLIMTEEHYQGYLKEFGNNKDLKEFLINVFVAFTEIVKRGIFLKDWIVIIVLGNSVILRAIQNFSEALRDNFSGDNLDYQLWNSYFNLSVSFLTQTHLQLENFTEVKKHKIIDRYGDMRVVMGFEIIQMWQSLGSLQSPFRLSLVCPFLEMTLVPQTELRKATLPIFFDMVKCELELKGLPNEVEIKIVNELDRLVSVDNKGDNEYKMLFNEILTEKFEADLAFRDQGIAFVNRVTDLLQLLLEYRRVSAEDDKEQKMSCLVNLLEFYEKIDRKDLYVRCIERLRDLHIASGNFTEAGYTVLEHAKLLEWSDLLVNDSPDPMTEFQLKEKLYLDAISFLDKGKTWEKAIELCKELAKQYKSYLFDYVKVGDILKMQAKFFDNIIKQVRPECEYFRVGFYGSGFPFSVRNKAFIYRGHEYEKIGTFNQRILSQFPDAQMMDKNTPPDIDILESDKQYLQCCRVIPISEHEERFVGKIVDDKISGYYRVNDVKRFTISRPLRPGSEDFANLWLERTTYVIASPLPGILRWFQITSSNSVEISPVLNAVETVESKNKELERIIARLSADKSQSVNPLSMILNGVIDAAVMGGIAKYEEAFFKPEFLTKNPKDKDLVNRLKGAIEKQVKVLEKGLQLHDELTTKDLRPFHLKMETCFAEMKARVTGGQRKATRPNTLPVNLPFGSSHGGSLRVGRGDRKNSLPAEFLREAVHSANSTKKRQSLSEQKSPQGLWLLKGEAHKKLTESKSLEALSEVEETAPPLPVKNSRSDSLPMGSPETLRRSSVLSRRIQHRSSSPASLLRYPTPISPLEENGKASPAIPPKQKSGLIHSSSDEDILNSAGPQTSFTIKETRPGDESITELSSQGDSVPLLPPKRHPILTPTVGEDAGLVPQLPEKRKSYASTASLTSRESSVFSDTASDHPSPSSPLSPSGQFSDKMEYILRNPYTLDSRGSSGSSTQTLSLSTARRDAEGIAFPSSNSNGYNFVTPPSSPRVLVDNVYSGDSVATWVSESKSYYSESSFDSDALSPGSPPLSKLDLDNGAQQLTSTPRSVDLAGQESPKEDRSTPQSSSLRGSETFSSSTRSLLISETTSTMSSITTQSESKIVSREESLSKSRTPVPVPRRSTYSASNRPAGLFSRSPSNATDFAASRREATPPQVIPRKPGVDSSSLSPPPKPPRPSQFGSPRRAPPVVPKPYASKTEDDSKEN
ncbi:dedicator of cytokinesis protein 1-like isoform X2 [Acropora palmata]|uniref:dedicator of cytokinesis protein 1-like isoform X2 n=1 Tax=Acropora palmata TaxID=6131 RepID=UPI003DA00F2D